jgi:hypothetical protein
MTASYAPFDSTKPSGTQTPTAFANDNLINLKALRDSVISGHATGFTQFRTQGTGPSAELPQYLGWTNGTTLVGFRMKVAWSAYKGYYFPSTIEWEWTDDNWSTSALMSAQMTLSVDYWHSILSSTNGGGIALWLLEAHSKLSRLKDTLAGVRLVNYSNVAIFGNSVMKYASPNLWDGGFYSKDMFTGGAWVSAVVTDTAGYKAIGLDTDPSADGGWTSLDYGFYVANGTTPQYMESSAAVSMTGTLAAGDVIAVVYDGLNIYYLHNGAVLRTVAVAAGLKFGIKGTIYTIGDGFHNIQFGPMTAGYAGTAWSDKSTSFNATKNNAYRITGNSVVMTLPASAAAGDVIGPIVASTGSITGFSVARNGLYLMGLAEDMTVDFPYFAFSLEYADASNGWRVF